MLRSTWLTLTTALLALPLGCGDDDGSTTTTAGTGTGTTSTTSSGSDSGGTTTTTTATTTASTSAGETGSTGGSGTGGQLCQDEIDALVPEVTNAQGGCSVVVRLDHDTLDLLGYQSTCSAFPTALLDEQGARDLTDCCSMGGTRLNPPTDDALWVFYISPGDFGDVAVVTNHVALRLFEATIIWLGTGEIGFPTAWNDPAALGSDCGDAEMPSMVSYDLVAGGTAVDPATVDAVWDVVGATALPLAMESVGQLQRVAVLRYPRSMGVFDPTTAEYIVILEGGI